LVIVFVTLKPIFVYAHIPTKALCKLRGTVVEHRI